MQRRWLPPGNAFARVLLSPLPVRSKAQVADAGAQELHAAADTAARATIMEEGDRKVAGARRTDGDTREIHGRKEPLAFMPLRSFRRSLEQRREPEHDHVERLPRNGSAREKSARACPT